MSNQNILCVLKDFAFNYTSVREVVLMVSCLIISLYLNLFKLQVFGLFLFSIIF